MLKNFEEINLNYTKIFDQIISYDYDIITKYNLINELKSELLRNLNKIVEKKTIKFNTDPTEILDKLRNYLQGACIHTVVEHKDYRHQIKIAHCSYDNIVYDTTEYVICDDESNEITKTLQFIKNDDVKIKSGLFIFNPVNSTFSIITKMSFSYNGQFQMYHRNENNQPISVIPQSNKLVYVELVDNPQYLKLVDKIKDSTKSIKKFNKLDKKVKIKPVKESTNYSELIELITNQ